MTAARRLTKVTIDMNNAPNTPENQASAINEAQAPKTKRLRVFDLAIFVVCFLISCSIWLYVTGMENGEFEYTFTDVVVNVDGASALLDEQGLSPYRTFDSISKFAELLGASKGKSFTPRISTHKITRK